MFWAAFLTCYFGFMRSGELCSSDSLEFLPSSKLSINDICVDKLQDPQWVRMNLKCSKTDPFGEGASIFILRTRNDLCPVVALLAWLIRRGNSPGPLFRFASGKNLTCDLFVKHLWEAIQAAGIDRTGFSGHSFHSGAATTAANFGVSDAHIKLMGRWKSNAYQKSISAHTHTRAVKDHISTYML